MGGLLKGYADGLQDSRSRSAESAASTAMRIASDAEGRASSAESHSRVMQSGAVMWRNKAEELAALLNVRTSKLSGCLMVINAVIKTMEEDLPPEMRERFRDHLVQRARQRMIDADNRLRGTPEYQDIEATFKALPENAALGVV